MVPFRKYRFESLEARRMLTPITVNNHLDDVNGDVASISSLIANDGGDGISLREAVQAANSTPGADNIQFDTNLSGKTITLGGTSIDVTDPVTIDGSSLADNLTIDANRLSRVLHVTDPQGIGVGFDFTVRRLNVLNGRSEGLLAGGGGVRSEIVGLVTLEEVTVSGNTTVGLFAHGGGLFAEGAVSIIDGRISDNMAIPEPDSISFSTGGGVYAAGDLTVTDTYLTGNTSAGNGGGVDGHSDVTVSNSTVSGNHSGNEGGGIRSGNGGTLTITDSLVANNFAESTGGGVLGMNISLLRTAVAENQAGAGGGIGSFGSVTLTESSIRNNSAREDGGGIYSLANFAAPTSVIRSSVHDNTASRGGGIWTRCAQVVMQQSTLSGNHGTGEFAQAGGAFTQCGTMTITQSTITDNHSAGSGSGGLSGLPTSYGTNSTLVGSVVAGNTSSGSSADIGFIADDAQIDFSLIGSTAGSGIDQQTGSGNLLDIDPLLGPLADNGGPTKTHALLPGSPAIDAGDPSVQFDPNTVDQRGQPFVRVADGDELTVIVVDMGSYEAQFAPSADFDDDFDVDGTDFLAWQRGFGLGGNAQRSDGNSDDDADVDASDLAAWQQSYGQAGMLPLVAEVSPIERSTARPIYPESDSASRDEAYRKFHIDGAIDQYRLPESERVRTSRPTQIAEYRKIEPNLADELLSELR